MARSRSSNTSADLCHWVIASIFAANPGRMDNRHPLLRRGSLTMVAILSVSNAVSAVLLVRDLLDGSGAAATAGRLLANGGAVYATNILAFALWYWEQDRGGPVARTYADERYPDLLFPQLANPDSASKEWEPEFVDYLYVSFTNATAFSPTDPVPLPRTTKAMMALQSAVALVVAAFVVARAVNILQ